MKQLPHFDTELTINNTPEPIISFRNEIVNADGVIICTPEYVFSIPSGLKNAIEWCVSTTIFSDKPTGLITASASGERGQEELQLIMRTLTAKFLSDTTLLINGVKGKVNNAGDIIHEKTKGDLIKFVDAFAALVLSS